MIENLCFCIVFLKGKFKAALLTAFTDETIEF